MRMKASLCTLHTFIYVDAWVQVRCNSMPQEQLYRVLPVCCRSQRSQRAFCRWHVGAKREVWRCLGSRWRLPSQLRPFSLYKSQSTGRGSFFCLFVVCNIRFYFYTLILQAREISNDLLESEHGDYVANWLNAVTLERHFGSVEGARALLYKAIEATKDKPQKLFQYFLQFEREEGTREEVDRAIEAVVKRNAQLKPAAPATRKQRRQAEAAATTKATTADDPSSEPNAETNQSPADSKRPRAQQLHEPRAKKRKKRPKAAANGQQAATAAAAVGAAVGADGQQTASTAANADGQEATSSKEDRKLMPPPPPPAPRRTALGAAGVSRTGIYGRKPRILM